MKLLDTSKTLGNTKARKTNRDESIRMATLTMHPDNVVCAGAKAAGCMDDCLVGAGLAEVYESINIARQARTDYWHDDQEAFLIQLNHELRNFAKLCAKQGVQGVVRLNVMSDVSWEEHYVPQSFSYSGATRYQNQVQSFLKSYSDSPMAVVFRHKDFPSTFMGRPVINGDDSDWVNVNNRGVVVGLVAKGPAKTNTNGFVVDNQVIPTLNF
jgi:hypothetical protein